MKKWKQTAGFTLVELIVVIAILGILAGVGTVGYSGYIKKANEAADIQMMGSVRYIAQIGIYENPSATGRILVDNDGAEVISTSGYQTVIEGWMEDAFGSAWQDTVKLVVPGASDWIAVPVIQLNLTNEQLELRDTFNKSNLGGNETELAKTTAQLSSMLSDWVVSKGTGVESLSAYFTDADGNPDSVKFAAFKDTYNLNETSTPTKIANAAVLYVASKASGMNAQSILSNVGDMGTVIQENDMLPTAALMYGTMAGYANSSYASDEFKTAFATPPQNLGDVWALVGKMKNDGANGGKITEYLTSNTDGALADMNGYLSALEIIDNYKDEFDIEEENVFNNDATLSLLQGVLSAK